MMDITLEQAEYIVKYYSKLMTIQEVKALRHYYSTVKLEGSEHEQRTLIYSKAGWLIDDPLILSYLTDGYDQFMLNCAERILSEDPEKVFFNFCPVCDRLARTPYAKQCRHCGHDWH
jgi:hypothetical protein